MPLQDKKKLDEYRLAYVRKNRDRLQAKKYGISLETFQQLLIQQHGVCAVCYRPERKKHSKTGQPWSLCIDHDHTTGKVRGLLCSDCNTVLGLLEDSCERALAVAQYLEFHNGKMD